MDRASASSPPAAPASVVRAILRATAAASPDRVALRCAAQRDAGGDDDGDLELVDVTFGQLRRRVAALVARLAALGVERGDRVALVADNGAHHVVLPLACAITGAIYVPVDFEAPRASQLEILADAEPRAVLVASAVREALAQAGLAAIELDEAEADALPEAGGDDLDAPWAIMYTSGTTTGRKKGAVRTQRGSVLGFFDHLCHMAFDEDDVFLAIYPSHGISTFFFAMMTLYFGGQCVLVSRRGALNGRLLLRLVHRLGVTFTTGGPSHLLAIIAAAEAAPPDASHAASHALSVKSLRQILVSGAMTSKSTQDRIRGSFPNAAFFEVYGSTECGMITMLAPHDYGTSAGSVGTETPGVAPLRFADPASGELQPAETGGEILAKTAMMFAGYWRREKLSRSCMAADGFFRTGDIGFKDAKGFLFLQGRADDRITLPSGVSFYPSEVERVVLAQGPVDHAFVFLAQQGIVCAVVLNAAGRSGAEADVPGVLRAACEAALAPQLVPQRFWLLLSPDALPKTATGKVQRAKLPETYRQAAGST